MGMFDYIDVHEKYLVDDEPFSGWQTKSLDNSLDLYELDMLGNLIRYTNLKEEGFGRMVKTNVVEFTGDLNFYTGLGEWSNGEFEWREYKATFLNGKLTNIERL